MNDASLTSRPSLTSGAMHTYWLMPTPVSTRTLARDDGRRRGKENLDVGPEGTPAGVAEVEAYHLVEGGTAPARDLPESGDSRFGFDESPPVPELVLDELVRKRGRGPISDISPRSTFHNCGSSSRLVFRRRRPIGVTRGSPVSLNSVAPGASTLPLDLMNRLTNSWCSLGSASTCIVRNLSIVNRFIMCPIRGCRKKTGPGDPRVTRTAISASSGDSATSKNRLPTRSKARLIPS